MNHPNDSTPKPPSPLIGRLGLPQITAILLRENNIHEGFYELSVEFGLAVGTFGAAGLAASPGVMCTVTALALRHCAEPNPLSVDAALANPRVKAAPATRKRSAAKPA